MCSHSAFLHSLYTLWIILYASVYEENERELRALFSFAPVACQPNCRPRDLLKAREAATVLIHRSHSPRNIRYYGPFEAAARELSQ